MKIKFKKTEQELMKKEIDRKINEIREKTKRLTKEEKEKFIEEFKKQNTGNRLKRRIQNEILKRIIN